MKILGSVAILAQEHFCSNRTLWHVLSQLAMSANPYEYATQDEYDSDIDREDGESFSFKVVKPVLTVKDEEDEATEVEVEDVTEQPDGEGFDLGDRADELEDIKLWMHEILDKMNTGPLRQDIHTALVNVVIASTAIEACGNKPSIKKVQKARDLTMGVINDFKDIKERVNCYFRPLKKLKRTATSTEAHPSADDSSRRKDSQLHI